MAKNDQMSQCPGGYASALSLFKGLKASQDPVTMLEESVSRHAIDPSGEELDQLAAAFPSLPLIWNLTSNVLEKLCQKDLASREFYAQLWRFISESALFGDDEEAVALFCALANPRLPYVQFDCPQMDDGTFLSKTDALSAELRKLKQVSCRSFSQKTQEALAALSIIDKGETPEDRAVLMAMFLSYVREGV